MNGLNDIKNEMRAQILKHSGVTINGITISLLLTQVLEAMHELEVRALAAEGTASLRNTWLLQEIVACCKAEYNYRGLALAEAQRKLKEHENERQRKREEGGQAASPDEHRTIAAQPTEA